MKIEHHELKKFTYQQWIELPPATAMPYSNIGVIHQCQDESKFQKLNEKIIGFIMYKRDEDGAFSIEKVEIT